MNKKSPVTERQIQEALQRFKDRGGLIRKLPPEVIPRALLVGTRHGCFEPIHYYQRAEGMTP